MEEKCLKTYVYTPTNICAQSLKMTIDVNNKTIEDVSFEGGCDGNHKGLNALLKGMSINEASEKLKGVTCGKRHTSCPDQLSKALESINLLLN